MSDILFKCIYILKNGNFSFRRTRGEKINQERVKETTMMKKKRERNIYIMPLIFYLLYFVGL